MVKALYISKDVKRITFLYNERLYYLVTVLITIYLIIRAV